MNPKTSRTRRLLLRAVGAGGGAALLGSAACGGSTTPQPQGTYTVDGGVLGTRAADAGPGGCSEDAFCGLMADDSGVVHGTLPAEAGLGDMIEDGGVHGTVVMDAGLTVADGGGQGTTVDDGGIAESGVLGTIAEPDAGATGH